MRQLRWGLKAEFPYTKVFILGIFLSVLGIACVVVSVVGITQLAWGYYVSTGMWGGVVVTVSGLSAMYAARAQTSISARLYFSLAVVACLVSFAMLVLSAGGLTYRSNFYKPVRFDRSTHRVTLLLHGSVLGVGVLSLACNVLSVIVCCKFMIREKDRGVESFKLRRHRHRLSSDPNAVYRNSSVRTGSGTGTVRSSTSSRTPLFGSDRSRKHSRQTSGSDFSTCQKIPTDRTSSHRRDSDRSRASSRSRQSHRRQSSSVSRQSGPLEAEVTTVLLRDSQLNSHSNRREEMSSRSTENTRDSMADTLTDNVSVQLVFDPDEEPLPPYEESQPVTVPTATTADCDADESDTETVDGSSSVVVPSLLPLNIPVTQLVGGAVERQALQRQPPPASASRARPSPQRRVVHHDEHIGAMHRNSSNSNNRSSPNGPSGHTLNDRDNRISLTRVGTTERRPWAQQSSPARQAARRQGDSSHPPHPLEDRSGSPEICALTGAGMTPAAAVQASTVSSNNNSSAVAAQIPQVQHSSDSSDTSIPRENVPAPQTPVTASQSHAGVAQPISTNSPSALPAGIRSPNSAFRPVGRRIGPMAAQGSPSHSVPLNNFFSPISSPASAHHVVYSPVASPSSPHHANNHLASSSESLGRGGSAQSLSWKKIPLPMSHNNHSNKTSSVPAKEVTSKNIPGPAVPPSDRDPQSRSLPRQSFGDGGKTSAFNSKSTEKSRSHFAPVSAKTNGSRDPSAQFATVPEVRRAKEASMPLSGPQLAPRHNSVDSVESRAAAVGGRSAFIGNRSGALGNHSSAVGIHPASAINSKPAHVSSRYKHSSVAVNPKTSTKGQSSSTQLDPGRRSAGIQATEEDGGISSSMDRTHRWVLGTLPSGTRFQGATKNIAHIHSASGSGNRSSAVARHSSRRDHKIWDHPSKAAPAVPVSSSASSSQPVIPQPIRPVPAGPSSAFVASSSSSSTHPLVPQPIRPLPGCLPSTTISSSQPVVPQPIRPVPGGQSFVSVLSSQPAVPQAIRPTPGGQSFTSIASSQPLVPQPVRPLPGGQSFTSIALSQPATSRSGRPEPGAMSFTSVVSSQQPIVPQPIRPLPVVASSHSVVLHPIKPAQDCMSAHSSASTQPVHPQPIRPKPTKATPSSQPNALDSMKPLTAELSSLSVITSTVPSHPSGLSSPKGPSSFSRLPRYQPVPQPRVREQPPPPQPLPRKQHQQPQQPEQQQPTDQGQQEQLSTKQQLLQQEEQELLSRKQQREKEQQHQTSRKQQLLQEEEQEMKLRKQQLLQEEQERLSSRKKQILQEEVQELLLRKQQLLQEEKQQSRKQQLLQEEAQEFLSRKQQLLQEEKQQQQPSRKQQLLQEEEQDLLSTKQRLLLEEQEQPTRKQQLLQEEEEELLSKKQNLLEEKRKQPSRKEQLLQEEEQEMLSRKQQQMQQEEQSAQLQQAQHLQLEQLQQQLSQQHLGQRQEPPRASRRIQRSQQQQQPPPPPPPPPPRYHQEVVQQQPQEEDLRQDLDQQGKPLFSLLL